MAEDAAAWDALTAPGTPKVGEPTSPLAGGGGAALRSIAPRVGSILTAVVLIDDDE
jgi:hypothetical protein